MSYGGVIAACKIIHDIIFRPTLAIYVFKRPVFHTSTILSIPKEPMDRRRYESHLSIQTLNMFVHCWAIHPAVESKCLISNIKSDNKPNLSQTPAMRGYQSLFIGAENRFYIEIIIDEIIPFFFFISVKKVIKCYFCLAVINSFSSIFPKYLQNLRILWFSSLHKTMQHVWVSRARTEISQDLFYDSITCTLSWNISFALEDKIY